MEAWWRTATGAVARVVVASGRLRGRPLRGRKALLFEGEMLWRALYFPLFEGEIVPFRRNRCKKGTRTDTSFYWLALTVPGAHQR